MRFRLLGPVEVWRGGERIPLKGRKQRTLLAMLALETSRTVPVDRLVLGLWGVHPPPSARAQVHNHVSALRRIPGVAIRHGAEGYLLDTDGVVDLNDFDSAVRSARAAIAAGDDARAADLLRTGLALWSEPVLGGVTDELRQMAAHVLTERRLAAVCDRIDADLRLGRHAELLAELRDLTVRHPLDDRFTSRLMLALHRSGRQADALRAYDEQRRNRRIELGLDPPPALSDLRTAILNADPALDPPNTRFEAPRRGGPVRLGGAQQRRVLGMLAAHAGSPVTTDQLVALLWGEDTPPSARTTVQIYISRLRKALNGSDVTITTTATGYQLDAPPDVDAGALLDAVPRAPNTPGQSAVEERPDTAAIVPRQLAARPRLFVGRSGDLARLTKLVEDRVDDAMTVVVVSGPGGIGKTWLTVQWARQNLHRFPDGQLHVDLRGFDPTDEPLAPTLALRGFLHALGVSSSPVDVPGQTGLYRSLTADRRMLVVLDNARETNQVVPLLPAGNGCTVLVTSRHRLPGLVATHGAHSMALDVLSDDDARDLLARAFGPEHVTAEPDAAALVLRHCAGLPLALGVGAARAVTEPGMSLPALADELRDDATRLAALDTGDAPAGLTAAFLGSYRTLSADTAMMFALLGLAPGPDLSLAAAASLSARPIAPTATLLRGLEQRSLTAQHQPGRYRMHDLLRLYAAERAAELPPGTRDAAVSRLVLHYLHKAVAADRLLAPHRSRPELAPLPPGAAAVEPTTHAEALAWFDREHDNLLATQRMAAQRAWHRETWQFAWASTTYHRHRGHVHDDLAALRLGVTATDRTGNPIDRAAAHKLLGQAYARLGLHTEALDHLRQALELSERTGDLHGRLRAHHALALTWARHGDHGRALHHAEMTLRLSREAQDPPWEATALNAIGWHSAKLGRLDNAAQHCADALDLFRRHRDDQGEASALDSLGFIAVAQGDHQTALRHYRDAVALFDRIGITYQQANALDHLAEVHHALGEIEEARAIWRKAHTLYTSQHRTTDAERVEQRRRDAD